MKQVSLGLNLSTKKTRKREFLGNSPTRTLLSRPAARL